MLQLIEVEHEAGTRLAVKLLLAAIAGGALLGLSTPLSIRWTLGPLAWFWLVPLLVTAGARTLASRFFGLALLSGLTTALICTWGVGQAIGPKWAPVYFAYAALTLAAPFVPFLVVRRLAGWEAALWSMPLVWPLTEWALRHVEGTMTWLTIAVTQANSTWTNQFADLFGEWGLTAWVMLFNVVLYRAWTREGSWRRLVKPAAAMLIPAVAYSAFQIQAENRRAAAAPPSARLKTLLVQPNVDIHAEDDSYMRNAIETAVRLTDEAVARSKPDVIVWPETAVPLALRTNVPARAFISQAVADWGTPLITGAFDTVHGAKMAPARSTTNAAMLLLPGAPGTSRAAVRFGASHAKTRLAPFVEAVPFARTFPALRKLKIGIGSTTRLQPGFDRQLLTWTADPGWKIAAAAPICFEELFASDFAAYARSGAQLFTVISDDAAFGKAASAHTLAAIGRLRAIETRRPVARATVTGMTAAIDPAGRIVASAPWWQPAAIEAGLVLNDRLTLYSQRPGLFPALCGYGLAALTIISGMKNWRRK